jgi:asparagine N-glycosylation enzyme membrane subunit Stt3
MEALATVITAVLVVVSPLAIAWAKRESWTKLVKIAVPILVSVTLAVAYLVATGKLATPGDWVQTILTVYGAQQLAYTTIMRWWASILEQVGNRPSGAHEAAVNADTTPGEHEA